MAPQLFGRPVRSTTGAFEAGFGGSGGWRRVGSAARLTARCGQVETGSIERSASRIVVTVFAQGQRDGNRRVR